MSRITKISCIFSLILIFNILSSNNTTVAQVPPPPPPNGGPSNGHGLGGNQPAGPGAPIGGGLEVLLALGALYSGKKVYTFRKGK
jgi:hypothetical protein